MKCREPLLRAVRNGGMRHFKTQPRAPRFRVLKLILQLSVAVMMLCAVVTAALAVTGHWGGVAPAFAGMLLGLVGIKYVNLQLDAQERQPQPIFRVRGTGETFRGNFSEADHAEIVRLMREEPDVNFRLGKRPEVFSGRTLESLGLGTGQDALAQRPVSAATPV